jgi:hypothetical protein
MDLRTNRLLVPAIVLALGLTTLGITRAVASSGSGSGLKACKTRHGYLALANSTGHCTGSSSHVKIAQRGPSDAYEAIDNFDPERPGPVYLRLPAGNYVITWSADPKTEMLARDGQVYTNIVDCSLHHGATHLDQVHETSTMIRNYWVGHVGNTTEAQFGHSAELRVECTLEVDDPSGEPADPSVLATTSLDQYRMTAIRVATLH